jgi:hypothetical protein
MTRERAGRYAAAIVLTMAAVSLGACGTANIPLNPSEWFAASGSSTSDIDAGFTVFRGGGDTRALQPVTPTDLVGPGGACQGGAAQPRGVVLTITECELVAAAGTPDQVNIGASEGGDRRTVMTYTKGENAGVYTFVEGRLKIIERLPTPSKPEPRRRGARKQPA